MRAVATSRMRFGPNSLAVRMVLLFTVTLIIAQAANFYMLIERRRAAVIQAVAWDAIERFAGFAADPDTVDRNGRWRRLGPPEQMHPAQHGFDDVRFHDGFPPPDQRPPPSPGASPQPLPRDGDFWIEEQPLAADVESSDDRMLRKLLIHALDEKHVAVTAASVVYAPSPAGPGASSASAQDARWEYSSDRIPPSYEIRLSAQFAETGEFLNGRMPVKPPPSRLAPSEFLASASVFLILMLGAIGALVANIRKPLADLSAAAREVGRGARQEPLPIRGPSEVREVMHAFNMMKTRVSDLLLEKDVMLGALGHDLRTPVTAVRLRVEKMEPVDQRQHIIQSLDNMSKLIDDILELTRSGGEEGRMSLFDVRSIAQDIVADYEELGRDVTLVASPRAVAACKPAAIQRLMRNLVDNALDYGGRASIRLGQTGEYTTITVDDDGPGIPDDSIETIVLPFRRGDASRNRSSGGAGLGLAIARTIARAHGGDLKLKNRTPHGLSVEATIRTLS